MRVALSPNQTDSNLSNNSSSDPTVLLAGTNLLLQKDDSSGDYSRVGPTGDASDAEDTFVAGQTATYRLRVSNPSTVDAVGPITIVDTLPTGVVYNSASGTNWTCNATGQTVVCTNPNTLTAGSNTSLTMTVNVLPSAPNSVTNTATVSSPNLEPNTLNNTASQINNITKPAPDLTISKTDNNLEFLYDGQASPYGLYLITVTNKTGAGVVATTEPTIVTDTLPNIVGTDANRLTYVGLDSDITSGTPDDWTCTVTPTATIPTIPTSSQVVTCTNNKALAPGQSSTIGLLVEPNFDPPGNGAFYTVTNNVSVSNADETNTSDNTASDTTIIRDEPNNTYDVAVAKSLTTAPTAPNTAISYTINVATAGQGNTDVTNGLFTDYLPSSIGGTITASCTVLGGGTGSGNNTCCTPTVNTGAKTVTCNGYQLKKGGGNLNIIIDGTATASGEIVNKAEAFPGTGLIDKNPADNVDFLATTVPGPDLSIIKTESPSTPDPWTEDSSATYRLTVTNTSASLTASSLINVTDTLPTGLDFVSAFSAPGSSGWDCNYSTSTRTVVCISDQDLAPGATSAIDINVIPNLNLAAGSYPTSINNTGNVSMSGDTNAANNSEPESTTVNRPNVDLVMTKTLETSPIVIGQEEVYRLTVTNAGTTPAIAPLTIEDQLPTGLSFLYTQNISGTWSCSLNAQNLTCTNYSNLAGGDSTSLDVHVLIGINTPSSIANNVRVSSISDLCTDFTNGNCTDTNNLNGQANDNKTSLVSTVSPTADLALTKTPVDQDSVAAGNQFYDATPGTYTITVTNNGPSNYTGAVLVNEDLGGITPTDPNFTYLSHSGSGWTCTQFGTANPCVAGDKNLQFSKTSLQAGESSTLTLTVSVPDGTTPNSYTNAVSLNNATLTAANDTIAGNNSATATVQVVNNLTTFTIDKDDDDGPGEPTTFTRQTQFVKGGVGQYTILVTNTGSVAAPAPVTITDTFPPGFTYASYDPKPTDWQCTGAVGGPSVSCVYGQWNANFTSFVQKDFPAGTTSGVAINVNVADATPPTTSTLSAGAYTGLTTNTASVSGSNFTTVSASEQTAIIQPADLQLTKTLDANGDGAADTSLLTANSTGVSRYSLTVKNNGPGTSYAPIYLQDYLPTGVTYNSNITLPPNWTFRGYNSNSNEVSYVYSGDLAPGADAGTIVMGVNVALNAPATTINLARVDGFTPEPDYDLTTPGYQDPSATICDRFFTTQPVNNCVTVERGVSGGIATDLQVVKIDDTPSDVNGADDDLDSVPFNTNFTYLIQVQNNGSTDANSVNLSDSIPEGLNFVSVAIDSGDNTSTNPYGTGADVTRVCSFDNLADRLNCNLYRVSTTENSADPIDITVTVTPILSGTIPNTAVVTSTTADSNSANNSELEETIVTGGTGNTISGTVFIDKNNNAAYDAGTDTPDQDITVRLYRDANNNNAIDANDVLLSTTSSGVDGTYSFVTTLTGNFILGVDTTDGDLPSNAIWTTAQVLDATLGASDTGNDFGYRTPPGNVLFVKRITAVNGVAITGFEDDTTSPKASEDNNTLWPTANTQYLRGAIGDRGTAPNNTDVNVEPGQEVEYTVYFLSSGGSPVRDVKFCDLIPAKMTYVPGSLQLGYNTSALTDPTGAGTTLTDAADADKGTFFAGGTAAPPICTNSNANGGNDNNPGTNDTGAVFVQIVDASTNMPYATGAGTPAGSYGFVRFRAKVN